MNWIQSCCVCFWSKLRANRCSTTQCWASRAQLRTPTQRRSCTNWHVFKQQPKTLKFASDASTAWATTWKLTFAVPTGTIACSWVRGIETPRRRKSLQANTTLQCRRKVFVFFLNHSPKWVTFFWPNLNNATVLEIRKIPSFYGAIYRVYWYEIYVLCQNWIR